jgi:hypothetical protein
MSVRLAKLTEAGIDWEDRSTHKTLTCINHQELRLSTKNPWDRSIFVFVDAECACPFQDLRVVLG